MWSDSQVKNHLFGVLILTKICPTLRWCHDQNYYNNHFTALWILSGTTQGSWYQKKHSPTDTYRGHQSSLICFLHLLQSTASFLFQLCAWQSFSTIALQVFFGLPLGLAVSTSYSIHFFIQSVSQTEDSQNYSDTDKYQLTGRHVWGSAHH